MKNIIAISSLLLTTQSFAQVQTPAPASLQPTSAAVSTPSSNVLIVDQTPKSDSVLRTGTPVSLRLLDQITTKEKKAKLHDIIRFEIAE